MPLVTNIKTLSGSVIGVWHITETVEVLKEAAGLDAGENEHYSRFRPELRKKHWLSYRLLLNTLLGEKQEVLYDEHGKPFLKGQKSYISVSHSGDYSAVIINPEIPVGIDIEKITARIEKVYDKFMSEKEISGIDEAFRLDYMYAYWCAKEALFKMAGKGNLDFCRDMTIDAFRYKSPGKLDATLISENVAEKHQLFYEKMDEYMLVYTPL